jgi:hypothetical protein
MCSGMSVLPCHAHAHAHVRTRITRTHLAPAATRRRRRSDGHNGGLPAAAPRVHEPGTSHTISGVVAGMTSAPAQKAQSHAHAYHSSASNAGTRTGIHAREYTHTHTHTRPHTHGHAHGNSRTRVQTHAHAATHTQPRAREFTHAHTRTRTRGHTNAGTRTGTHARAHTHPHARPHTHGHAHGNSRTRVHAHIDIGFGVSPLTPKFAVCWSGDGYGHVLWPPRTNTRIGDVQTSSVRYCRHLHGNVSQFEHAHAKHATRVRPHTHTHMFGKPRLQCRDGTAQTEPTSDGSKTQTRLRIHRIAQCHAGEAHTQIRLAPARDYTHYIHVCLNLVSLHVHDRC